MKCLLLLFSVIFLFAGIKTIDAQQTTKWGDQGNGTFRNPVLPGDFSDPDVIRVGDDYYGISSTLQESPGMVVFHSKDLVNWEIIGHVVDGTTIAHYGMTMEMPTSLLRILAGMSGVHEFSE